MYILRFSITPRCISNSQNCRDRVFSKKSTWNIFCTARDNFRKIPATEVNVILQKFLKKNARVYCWFFFLNKNSEIQKNNWFDKKKENLKDFVLRRGVYTFFKNVPDLIGWVYGFFFIYYTYGYSYIYLFQKAVH